MIVMSSPDVQTSFLPVPVAFSLIEILQKMADNLLTLFEFA